MLNNFFNIEDNEFTEKIEIKLILNLDEYLKSFGYEIKDKRT